MWVGRVKELSSYCDCAACARVTGGCAKSSCHTYFTKPILACTDLVRNADPLDPQPAAPVSTVSAALRAAAASGDPSPPTTVCRVARHGAVESAPAGAERRPGSGGPRRRARGGTLERRRPRPARQLSPRLVRRRVVSSDPCTASGDHSRLQASDFEADPSRARAATQRRRWRGAGTRDAGCSPSLTHSSEAATGGGPRQLSDAY